MKIARSRLGKLLSVLVLVLVLVLLGIFFPVFCYFFFINLTRVPTGAMANTIIPGDYLIVKKRAFGEVNRGDIVVFKFPKDPSVRYVSRVIGLPHETIETRGVSVYINGTQLGEQRVMVTPNDRADVLQELSTEGSGPYRVFYSFRTEGDGSGISSELERDTVGINAPFKIPDNEYFVMGDNRDNSYDSRFWGTVPRTLVVGKPTMIYWSAHSDRERNDSIRWNRIFSKIR